MAVGWRYWDTSVILFVLLLPVDPYSVPPVQCYEQVELLSKDDWRPLADKLRWTDTVIQCWQMHLCTHSSKLPILTVAYPNSRAVWLVSDLDSLSSCNPLFPCWLRERHCHPYRSFYPIFLWFSAADALHMAKKSPWATKNLMKEIHVICRVFQLIMVLNKSWNHSHCN